MSAPYLKIAIVGTIIMLGLSFIMDSIGQAENMNILDLTDNYNSLGNAANGQALNSPAVNTTQSDHTLTFGVPGGDVTIPYIGEFLYFLYSMAMIVFSILSGIIGFILSIALLSTKFPSFLTPIIAMGQLIVVISWYKVLTPSE